MYCLSESAKGSTSTPLGPPAARMKRSVFLGGAVSSARMRARVAGLLIRAIIESTPPACAHAGIEASSDVAAAMYGYRLAVTSSPAVRAESMRPSTCVMRPALRRPATLRCQISAGMCAERGRVLERRGQPQRALQHRGVHQRLHVRQLGGRGAAVVRPDHGEPHLSSPHEGGEVDGRAGAR